jgi:two-component system, OmpR family, KDP operon response regulator KdpE
MLRTSILIVEDDHSINNNIQTACELEGWETHAVFNEAEAIKFLNKKVPNIIILDMMLPNINGIEIYRQVTYHSLAPTIIVNANKDEQIKIQCLEMGSDDYITKPFRMRELIARIKAILRRCQKEESVSTPTIFSNEDFYFNFVTRHFKVRGKEIKLSRLEHRLLEELIKNAGKTLTFDYLLHKVWGSEYGSEREYLYVYLGRLRMKIEPDPKHPKYLINDPGVGYTFRFNN